MYQQPPPPSNLPRILCLHGGGVNAEVFQMQFRCLAPVLSPHFRLVWADGPYLCAGHPDIMPVYGDFGPFRRWFRWRQEHDEVDTDSAIEEITYQLQTAMEADNNAGGSGEWVGLLGFSQGAKVAASLLLEQETREREQSGGGEGNGKTACGIEGVHWKFGVLMAGRAPLVALSKSQKQAKGLASAADLTEGYQFEPGSLSEDAILKTPTLHVHGLQDPGLELHRILLTQYCQPGSTMLVEWDEGHRLPIKSWDVEAVSNAIFEIAKKAGVDISSK